MPNPIRGLSRRAGGRRYALRAGATLAVAAIGLAACGGSTKSTSTSSSGSNSGPTYTIAYEGPLSGGEAQLGLYQKYAVQLAINNANAGKTFGKLPFKLKFLPEDDQGSATQAPTAAQAALNDSSVMAVVGPAFSGASAAADPIYAQANLADVTPSATNPALQTHGWGDFFRVVANDNQQGPADADYVVQKLGAKKVYAIDDASSYGQGLVSAFETEAKAKGATLTHDTVPGTTQCQGGTGNVQEYGAESTKVKAADPQVVFYAGYYCDFALLTKALRSGGYTGQLMSDDGSENTDYITQAGATDAAGALMSCACADITKASSSAAKDFVSGFTALAKQAPGTYSGEAYDATNTIIDVMKSLGKNMTRAGVVSGLHGVSYQGLTKTVKFQPDGDIAGNAVYIYKVEGSNLVQLGTVSQLVGS
jgi:branched-chain amino acid transport system substrate-binding protein